MTGLESLAILFLLLFFKIKRRFFRLRKKTAFGHCNFAFEINSEVWQSWSNAPVLKTGRRKRLRGSNPLASA